MAPALQPKLTKLMQLVEERGSGFQNVREMEVEMKEVKRQLNVSDSSSASESESVESKSDSDDELKKINLMMDEDESDKSADSDSEANLTASLWSRLWVLKHEVKAAKKECAELNHAIQALGNELAAIQYHVISDVEEVGAINYLMDRFGFTGDVRLQPLLTQSTRLAIITELESLDIPFVEEDDDHFHEG